MRLYEMQRYNYFEYQIHEKQKKIKKISYILIIST